VNLGDERNIGMPRINLPRRFAALILAGAALAATPLAPVVAAPRAAGPLPADPRVPMLHWRACHHGYECATARVPLDYRHPRGKLINIAVIMHRAAKAAERPPTLFVNGGGPSAQVSGFVADFPEIPAALRESFNIVSFDPRGFGFSTPIRCFSSEAAESRLLRPVTPFPRFPVGPRQTATFERTYSKFGAQCARTAGPLLGHDTSTDVARDMNLLRQAVGAPRLNYLGLSYGTGLGAIYANLFPSAVGHMVLDGNLNPVEWTSGGRLPAFIRERDDLAAAAENRSFLLLCGQRPASACAFSAGSPAATRAKFAKLQQRLLHHPVTVDGLRVTYPVLFQLVPPTDVAGWQPVATQLQQIWTASGRTSQARPAPAARPGRPSGGPSSAGAPYTRTMWPPPGSPVPAPGGSARSKSGSRPCAAGGCVTLARISTPARGIGAPPARSW
jgi:pimeloyl-ACP methyl ester carboxylesterase